MRLSWTYMTVERSGYQTTLIHRINTCSGSIPHGIHNLCLRSVSYIVYLQRTTICPWSYDDYTGAHTKLDTHRPNPQTI